MYSMLCWSGVDHCYTGAFDLSVLLMACNAYEQGWCMLHQTVVKKASGHTAKQ